MTSISTNRRLDGDREAVLVDAKWLTAHANDPTVRVVEVDVSPATYDAGHIDGAVLWNVYADLKDSDYRLADHTRIERLLSKPGIRPDSTVVFYGYAPALGFWLMKLYGHEDVCILDCSRDTWQARHLPWSISQTEPVATTYDLGDTDRNVRAVLDDVRAAIGNPAITLVDVRTDLEFRGERFWPSGGLEPGGRAGHVPTARHQPIDGLFHDDGSYRTTSELRAQFSYVDLDRVDELITYCTIGGRAATAWFVLTYLLGRSGVRVYDGSWAEWGRTAGTPVAPDALASTPR